MFSAIPGLYRWLGGGLAIVMLLGGVWLHGRSKGVESMRGEVAEARAETMIVVSQRDQCRTSVGVLAQQIEEQNAAISEWKVAAENYRDSLTAALRKPPKVVYREVVVESEDCTDAVVEVAGEIADALR